MKSLSTGFWETLGKIFDFVSGIDEFYWSEVVWSGVEWSGGRGAVQSGTMSGITV